jgi:lantibiotic modifying enzyme
MKNREISWRNGQYEGTYVMLEETSSASQLLQYDPDLGKARRPWQSFLSEPFSTYTRDAALLIAEQMRDPEFVSETAILTGQRSIYPSSGWLATCLANGDAGMAMMYGYLEKCFPGQGWEALAQVYLRRAAAATQHTQLIFPGLFAGTAGMAVAIATLNNNGQRYRKMLDRLHAGLCTQVLQRNWQGAREQDGVADSDYDVVSGASGVLAYLVSIKSPNEQVLSAVETLLRYLLWLAEPGQPHNLERWYVPPALLATDRHREQYPQGAFNCGLAHGIPGPLAALALTWLSGYRYPGLSEAIAYLSEWLIEHRLTDDWGINWPAAVPFEASASPQEWREVEPTRGAWCYGSPGVARSLALAGQALEDKRLSQIALEAIEAVLHRPLEKLFLPSPTLCHGTAGLLQICLHFANESESPLVKEHITLLTEQILDTFDPAAAFSFYDRDEVQPLDQPAWLTGTAGTAMTLLAAATSTFPTWDRALAIA